MNVSSWMSPMLRIAGIYNLAWGGFVILFPLWPFFMAGMDVPRYPQLWQCVGMIVGVYGVGYLIAARAPLRHWPIVLVGLLGKVLGPIGFVFYAWRGEIPWITGWLIVVNDLIWWIPFAVVLLCAARQRVSELNGIT